MKITKKIRNVLSTALIVTMMSAMLTGCSKGSTADASTVLNFGCTNFSESLDPSAMPNAAWAVSRYGIGESLFKFDDKMEADYNLCDEYSVNEDNTEWKLHIRENLKFSNGKEVTASSVVKSIEYMYEQEKSGKGSTAPSQYMIYDSIKADDESRTVTIKTSKPYADLTKALAHPFFVILDMESDLANNPVGTGPYVIDKYDVGVSVAMKANEHYWKEEVPYEKINISYEYHVGNGFEYTSFTDCIRALKDDERKKTIYKICLSKYIRDDRYIAVYSGGYFFYFTGSGRGRYHGTQSGTSAVQLYFCHRSDDRRGKCHSLCG